MKNARFWIYLNGGPVKLTLRPGQSLRWWQGGPCDEGWSSESETWTLDEDENVLRREWCNDGSDCDGRLTRYGECEANLDELFVVEPYFSDDEQGLWEGVKYPDWQRVSAGQRDQYAESMGY